MLFLILFQILNRSLYQVMYCVNSFRKVSRRRRRDYPQAHAVIELISNSADAALTA
jgi:hypothetical protein